MINDMDMEYNSKDLIFSLDIGTRSIIGSVGILENNKFKVVCEKYKEHEERAMIDGQIHDINLVAKTVDFVKKEIEKELNIVLKEVSIAAAGRFLRTVVARADLELSGEEEINKDIIRGIELSAVKKAEEEICQGKDGKLYCVGYSVKGYYLNSYIISNLLGHKGEHIGAEVIATFLPRSVIDSLYAVMDKVELNVFNLTLEPIAAIEAAVPQKLRLLNIALVDIGAGTSDIAISSKETISGYGMVPMAGDEVTETIAQQFLVDFNDAERIKREIGLNEEIKYTDILGIENIVTSEELQKIIRPTIKKIGEAISKKIVELNGGKPPAAIFLVGGGAHTPFIIDEIAENLNMPIQRIAIKDRSAVEECISDNEMGSAGVTVLGIALTAIRRLGDNFIDVQLNGEIVSLFNSRKNTVLDVLMQAGINPVLLIGKNGKSKRFIINGKKRIIFGELGKNAKILVNGNIADTDTEINARDVIEIEYAKIGNDAVASVSKFVGDISSISIYLNNEIVNIDPICMINNEEKPFTTKINDDDEVNVFLPNTISYIKKYVIKKDIHIFKDETLLSDDYVVTDCEYITTKDDNKNEIIKEIKEESTEKIADGAELKVIVNNKEVILTGRKSYIFVDLFNYIDFDVQNVQGKSIELMLNGTKAAFTDVLKENDEISIRWVN